MYEPVFRPVPRSREDHAARGKGNIINISSMASQYGIPKVIAYTASKAAIEGMTRAMAVELSPDGILRQLHRTWLHRHGYVRQSP